MTTPEAEKTKSDDLLSDSALYEVLGITDEDLAANREGRLTDGQVARLNYSRRNRRGFIDSRWFWTVVYFVESGVFYVLVTVSDDFASFFVEHSFFFLGFMIVLPGVISVLQIVLHLLNTRRDANSRRVEMTEGVISLDVRHSGRKSSFFVVIDTLRLNIAEQVFYAFKSGDPYRIYYIPHSQQIVAAEWLGEDPFE